MFPRPNWQVLIIYFLLVKVCNFQEQLRQRLQTFRISMNQYLIRLNYLSLLFGFAAGHKHV